MAKAPILLLDVLIEEERLQDYDSRDLYPFNLEEIFDDGYEVVWKVATRLSGLLVTFIGTCQLNTNLDGIEVLWNCFKDKYVVLKIFTTDVNPIDQAHHELRLTRHDAAAKPEHLGLKYISTVKDSFEILPRVRRGHTHVSCLWANAGTSLDVAATNVRWHLFIRSSYIYRQVLPHCIVLHP
jgi:hypothetical protein